MDRGKVNTNDGDFLLSFGERSLRDALDVAAPRGGRILVLDSSFDGESKWVNIFNGRGEYRSEFEVVPNAVAASLHPGDWNVVVALLLFHVESVKYPAKISLYSGSGDH